MLPSRGGQDDYKQGCREEAEGFDSFGSNKEAKAFGSPGSGFQVVVFGSGNRCHHGQMSSGDSQWPYGPLPALEVGQLEEMQSCPTNREGGAGVGSLLHWVMMISSEYPNRSNVQFQGIVWSSKFLGCSVGAFVTSGHFVAPQPEVLVQNWHKHFEVYNSDIQACIVTP